MPVKNISDAMTSCATCAYSMDLYDANYKVTDQIVCRLNPPTVVDTTGRCYWPIVGRKQACGQWTDSHEMRRTREMENA